MTHKPNGCGAEGSRLDPPEFIFHKACNEHDSLYHVGTTRKDKAAADSTFGVRMDEAVNKAPWYYRPFYSLMAKLYHLAVRKGGGKAFRKGKGLGV